MSDSVDEISIKMENGYQDYLSTKQKDSALKVSYHSGHHHFEKGPTFTVVLPRQCENLTLDIVVGAGDISMESEAFTARKGKCVYWSGRTLCESDFSQRESRV